MCVLNRKKAHLYCIKFYPLYCNAWLLIYNIQIKCWYIRVHLSMRTLCRGIGIPAVSWNANTESHWRVNTTDWAVFKYSH